METGWPLRVLPKSTLLDFRMVKCSSLHIQVLAIGLLQLCDHLFPATHGEDLAGATHNLFRGGAAFELCVSGGAKLSRPTGRCWTDQRSDRRTPRRGVRSRCFSLRAAALSSSPWRPYDHLALPEWLTKRSVGT